EAKATAENPSRVINISSIDGCRSPFLETYAYSASKAAVNMLTKHLAIRLAGSNINVNAIAAGPFETKMMAETLRNYRDSVTGATLRGRIGNAEDISAACIFLAARSGAWLT